MKEAYKKQVALLLDILPSIAEEKAFALHGGIAINLFHLGMPRFSVDIDLTYIPFSNDRNTDLNNIRNSLEAVKARLKYRIHVVRFSDQQRASEELKLICSTPEAMVKIEVNQIRSRTEISYTYSSRHCEGLPEAIQPVKTWIASLRSQ
jgi:predicted nucleotidyltransferase component of viral defense system